MFFVYMSLFCILLNGGITVLAHRNGWVVCRNVNLCCVMLGNFTLGFNVCYVMLHSRLL